MRERLSRRHGEYKFEFLFLILLFSFFSCNGEPEEPPPPPPTSWNAVLPLRNIYADDFLIGNIISPNDLANVRFDILKWHYNTVTAENQMKPDFIAPSSKPADNNWNYRWTGADSIVDAARTAGMKVVGHTLIWHSQTPAWLTEDDAATVENNLNKYVTDVVTHFKGKLISWDVVNEAMKESGDITESAAANWKTCLRPQSGNKWAIVDDYIEKAFLAARNADPDVKLFYNDYSLNYNKSVGHKALAVYNMVNDINTRYPNVQGRPLIDGIGMQSHHHRNTSPETVEDSIKMFASLGVEIAISEMDILTTGSLVTPAPAWNENDIQHQATRYAAMFRIFKDNAAVISRVTFWGLNDSTSWRSAYYPTLLDKDYNLKPAFYAVMYPYGY